jgi:chloramphenicol 3-O-phosphotransferase
VGFRAAPPAAYLVTGAQASGKSSVAEALARRFPRSVHVRGDVFRRMIVRGRQDMTPDAGPGATTQLTLRHRLTALAADEYHRAGFTTVIQDIVIGDHLAAMVAALHARPLHVVVLTARPDILATRDAARPTPTYGETWPPEQLDHILRQETAPIGLWLDTSDLTVEQTVDEILHRPHETQVTTHRL